MAFVCIFLFVKCFLGCKLQYLKIHLNFFNNIAILDDASLRHFFLLNVISFAIILSFYVQLIFNYLLVD